MVHLVHKKSETDFKTREAQLGELNQDLRKKLADQSELMRKLRQISDEIDQDISSLVDSSRRQHVLQKTGVRKKGTRKPSNAA